MSQKKNLRRRDFLRGSAKGLAAAVTLPTIVPSGVVKAQDRPAPSDRVVCAVIGTGGLGRRHHLDGCLLPNPRVEVAAVCDVDRQRVNGAASDVKEKTGRRVGVYEDFRELLERKDLDAAVCALPDHWHAIVAIACMEAGLDVYAEKPLTLTIDEGRKMVQAARRYGTVFQTGSQQRSDGRFRQACELVRNGKIGQIKRIDTVLHKVSPGEWQPAVTPPSYFNWNFWLGPAPYKEYRPNLVHYQFRWQYDYSGGVMTDWGAHHNDIAQWALGMDKSGPVYVEPINVEFAPNGPHDVPLDFDVHYKYANGVDLYCHTGDQEYEDGTKFGNGVKFTGTDGWIFVSRREIQASDPDILKIELGSNDVRLYNSRNHHENWIDCIESRQYPICDVEIGHRSVTVCHIGNIAMRLGRALKWDPKTERFIGDDVANAMRSKPMRAPWQV